MNLRILHFSDVHLPVPPGAFRGPGMLHPKRMLAGLNYVLRRSQSFAEAPQKLHALADFLRREPVDYILYTGDTLNFGLEKEFASAASRLSETLSLARGGYLAVPGNHDLYSGASQAYHRRYFQSFMSSDLPGCASATGYPLVRWMGDDAAAIAFNTARPQFAFWNSSGRVPSLEMEALNQLLERPEIAGRRHVFLMTHYPFDEAGRLHGLRNARTLLRILHGRRNLVLLHGHNHRPYTYFLPGSDMPLYCSGSLSKAGRESFWLFDILGDSLNARRGIWRNARFSLAG